MESGNILIKNRVSTKKVLSAICAIFLLILALAYLSVGFDDSVPAEPEITRHPVSPGSVIDAGGYITFEGLDIFYDGESFSITNNREDIVRISAEVVGVKSNGDYDAFYWPAFYGTDETQYQLDSEENGWAVASPTNMIRPGETLVAKMYIYDLGDDYPDPDIDHDGYYDILFTVHPQKSEDRIQAATSDPVSDLYKLAVD